MSNNIKKVCHPGFYLKEYLEEIQMTQDEFSKRLGISGKQVSLIISENASITADIAFKLSKLIGTSTEMWLALQAKYDIYKLEREFLKSLEEEKKIYKMIDQEFLLKLNIIDCKDTLSEAISKLRQVSMVSSLTLHTKKDIFSFYNSVIDKTDKIENIVCKNVWVSIATSIAKNEKVNPFNENKLLTSIDEFKKMTLEKVEDVYPKLKKRLNECGVALVILPSLKNSNINGVVKWLDSEMVMMALNTKEVDNDRFWFSFFHELKHVLQKTKRKVLVGADNNIDLSSLYEYDADNFAKETLVPTSLLNNLTNYDEKSIVDFSTINNVHPGIVVARLQQDGKIKTNQFNHLKEKVIINIQK